MSKWKKLSAFLLSLVCLLSGILLPARALEATGKEPISTEGQYVPAPSLSAQSALLMEAESGSVIYEKEGSERLPMASTTKIMTALVALEIADPAQRITVTAEAVGVEGSSIYLTEGETLTLEELLYALLLESANDAAVAIAVGLSGSIEAFAEQMNRTAKELELSNSHFTNPHGLDHEEHYTTARDLAVITRRALEHPLFCTIISTRKTTIPHDNTDGVRLLINHNKLLRMYDGCIGVKTGYTKRSGRCLVSAAEREGVTLIAVTLNAPNDWKDHSALLDYGFSRYRSVLLCEGEEFLFPLPVTGGCEDYVMVGNSDALRAILPAGHGSIVIRIEAPRFLYAAVESGEEIGRVVFHCDTLGNGQLQTVGEVPLYTRYAVEAKQSKKGFWSWLLGLFGKASGQTREP